MNTKLINQYFVQYEPARYNGVNLSGWHPVNDYVLVLPDKIKEKTSGGIDLPDEISERMQMASITGTIVACGDAAFAWNADRTRPFGGKKPEAGTRVIFEKYGGKVILGEDGENYRILDDKAIGGVKA